MSTWAEHDVRCAVCGHGFSVQLLKGMHITRLPEVKAQLLEGRFQVACCPACGAPHGLERPTIYTDFDRRLYLALELDGVDRALERRALHQKVFDDCFLFGPDIAAELGQGLTCRLVFGVRALREKVLAFEHGVDDRAIEGVKLLIAGERDWDLTEVVMRLLAVHTGGHLLFGVYPFTLRERPTEARVVENPPALHHVTVTADRVAAVQGDLAQLRGEAPWVFERWIVDASLGAVVFRGAVAPVAGP